MAELNKYFRYKDSTEYLTAWVHHLTAEQQILTIDDVEGTGHQNATELVNGFSALADTDGETAIIANLDGDIRIGAHTESGGLYGDIYVGLTRYARILLYPSDSPVINQLRSVRLVVDVDELTGDIVGAGFIVWSTNAMTAPEMLIELTPETTEPRILEGLTTASDAKGGEMVETIAGQITWTRLNDSVYNNPLLSEEQHYAGFGYGTTDGVHYLYDSDADLSRYIGMTPPFIEGASAQQAHTPPFPFDVTGTGQYVESLTNPDHKFIDLVGTNLLRSPYTTEIDVEYAGVTYHVKGIYLAETGYMYGMVSTATKTGPAMIKIDGTEAPINWGKRDPTTPPDQYTTGIFNDDYLYIAKLDDDYDSTSGQVAFLEALRSQYRVSNPGQDDYFDYSFNTFMTFKTVAEQTTEGVYKALEDSNGDSVLREAPNPDTPTEPPAGPSEEEQERERVNDELSTDTAIQKGEQGGDGDFEQSRNNNPLTTDELPNDSSAVQYMSLIGDSVRVYRPTPEQLMGLFTAMRNNTIIDKIKNYMQADPMNFINSLHIVAGQLPTDKLTTGEVDITIAGQLLSYDVGGVDTPVQMKRVKNATIDGVTRAGNIIEIEYQPLTIYKGLGNFTDYENTPIDIYLPFIGYRQLDARDIWHKPQLDTNPDGAVTLHLKYFVDVIYGSCTAVLYKGATATSPEAGETYADIIGQWSGVCRMDIPITSTRYTSVMQNIIGAIGSGVTLASGVATGNAFAIGMGAVGLVEQGSTLASSFNNPSVSHRDGSASNGWYQSKTPFLKIYRPNPTLAKGFAHYYGWGYKANVKLSDFKSANGQFIKFTAIHWDEINPPRISSAEMDKIEQLLKGGVYA